jgi:hypothetical protein
VLNADRAIGAILAACVAAIIALGSGLLWRARQAPPPPPTALATATPTSSPRATPTGALPEAARQYRLAGTVAGAVSYAILEGPGGTNELLQPGEVIRGLGQVIAIGEDSITIEDESGRFELRIAPAPTVTAAPTLAPPPTLGPPRRAPSRRESSLSSEPDRPAS